MKKFLFFPAVIFLLAACVNQEKKPSVMNPFLEAYNTQFEVPPFDKIHNSHFLPAFQEAIRQHNAEIKSIIDSEKKPDFANTIEALDYSGSRLKSVKNAFSNLKEAVTNDSLQEIARIVAPMLSKHTDEVNLNEQLFDRVKGVYDCRTSFNLNTEQSMLLAETYKRFVRGGANLDANRKQLLQKVNEQLSLLDLKFGDNMLAETNDYKMVIDNKDDLSGLPEAVITGASDEAKTLNMNGKWVFTLQKPSWIPFVTYAKNRSLREKIYKAMYNRGNNGNEHDNKKVISELVNLRLQKANIMGYDSWSSYVLDDCMAKTSANVYKLLRQVWTPAIRRAKEEAKDMQAMISKEGGHFKLESWDWWYYAEKVRKEKYDLDEEQIRPYFELNNVRDGAFTVAGKLYGLKFVRLNNMPLYHPECEVYEVKDSDESHLGVLYMDFFPRASKKGGAWMNNYREQYINRDGKDVRPVVSVTCNFSKPTGDKPALLSFEEVETLFHEFGHSIHGLLSKCHYESTSGTNVARDFVELPSQVMEHWASEPEVLRIYAKHYKSGEIIPKTLIDKIVNAGKFNQGFATVEYLAAAILDMDYHTITKGGDIDINQFEKTSMEKLGLIPEIIPRYKSTYFAHTFSGNGEYSSGYYSYIWAQVLDCDTFEAFKETGNIFNPKVSASFKKNVLERGKTDEAMRLYVNFRGKEPSIEPLLRSRGLN